MSSRNEAKDFHDKELPKVGSDHTCLAVITDFALKKMKSTNIFKRVQVHWKEKVVRFVTDEQKNFLFVLMKLNFSFTKLAKGFSQMLCKLF